MSISRRTFLRGTAGAMIALPMLDAMPVRAGGEVPKRFVVFHRPWGTIPTHWIPDGTGREFSLREIMQPLSDLHARGKLSVVTGVSLESAHAQYAGAGSHPCGENHALTARFQQREIYRCIRNDVEVEVSDYRACLDGNLDIFGAPGGASIDHVVAEHIWGGTRLKHLVVGRSEGSSRSVDASGNTIPLVTDLGSLFATLFSGVSTDEGAMSAAIRRRASILDHARGDMERLRSRVSVADRERLESHYTAIREVELSLTGSHRACGVPDHPGDGLSFEGERWIENMHTAHRLIGMALACDITRVVSIFWHTDGVPLETLRSLDPRIHADPHGEGSHAFPDDAPRVDNAVALHKVFIGLFAQLAGELDRTDRLEATGTTVLDNSVLLHTSDMVTGLHTFRSGEGAWNRRDTGQYGRGAPYLFAGSAGDALKSGEHFVLDAPDFAGRFSHGELFLTLARALGIGPDRLASFGDPGFCHTTIDALLR
jgi:hypothetical protein